jgi:hypothetical protein
MLFIGAVRSLLLRCTIRRFRPIPLPDNDALLRSVCLEALAVKYADCAGEPPPDGQVTRDLSPSWIAWLRSHPGDGSHE